MPDNLAKKTTLVSAMTMVSRVLGFLRDMITAVVFGATAEYDAFLVAFKIPNFFRSLFAEGAFTQAFVPLLSEQQCKDNDTKALNLFINRVFTLLLFTLLLLVVIGTLAAPYLIQLFAAGFSVDGPRYAMAIDMLRITLPYLLLVSLTALSGSVLNCFNCFAVPAFTPVLLNIGMIICAFVASLNAHLGIQALAWGVLLGGLMQLIFQIPFLAQRSLLPRIDGEIDYGPVRLLLKRLVPALFGVSVVQMNAIVSTFFASYLPAGSITWLYYAERLMQFPLGVFGVALATVVLPYLSKKHTQQSDHAYQSALDWSLRCVLLIGLPASIGLYCLSGPLLVSLFQYGTFQMHDVLETRVSLQAYACGIIGFIALKVIGSAYYAKKDIVTPARAACVALLINASLSYLLVNRLQHAGLAIASSVAGTTASVSLIWYMVWRGDYHFQGGWLGYCVKIVFAAAIMGLFLQFTSAGWQNWTDYTWYSRIYHLFSLVLLGATIYFCCLWVIGLRYAHIRAPLLT